MENETKTRFSRNVINVFIFGFATRKLGILPRRKQTQPQNFSLN